MLTISQLLLTLFLNIKNKNVLAFNNNTSFLSWKKSHMLH